MARNLDLPSSLAPGSKTMSMTIQCPNCGVVLNVPESAAGRKLKCPHCDSKFPAPMLKPGDSAIAGGNPQSSQLRTRGPGPGSSMDLPLSRGSSGSVELPDLGGGGIDFDLPTASSSAPLRETFELPMLGEDVPRSKTKPKPGTNTADAAPLADVMALFKDEPKTARRPKGAEARAHTRRCPTCGGVVGVGMSLCNRCGLDLDTGQRVIIDLLDDGMPEAIQAPSTAMGVIFVGSLFAMMNLILTAATVVAWAKGNLPGAPLLLIVWIFGLYAAVQFLRRRSLRGLFLALSLNVGIGAVYLIALPIFYANAGDDSAPPIAVSADDPDTPQYRPLTETLDMKKITGGIITLLVYAGVSVYLNTPGLRKQFKR